VRYIKLTHVGFRAHVKIASRGSAPKIKHHHCHKILRRNNWIKLTLWLKLCRKSVQCLKKHDHGSTGHDSRVMTRDPRDPLRFVDQFTRWPADPLSSLPLSFRAVFWFPSTADELHFAADTKPAVQVHCTSGHSAGSDTDCCCCCCCWGCCVKASHQLVIPVLTAPSQNGLKTKQPCKNCSRKTLPAYMRMYAECPYTCVVEL